MSTTVQLISVPPASTGVPRVDAGASSVAQTTIYDVDSYASVSAAVTAIGTTVATLRISTAVTVSSNLTIPSTLSLDIYGAGSVSVASGSTLTINGGVRSTQTKALTFLGAGTVSTTAQAFYADSIGGESWVGTAISSTSGGTGLNTGASSGIPTLNAGNWSINNVLTTNRVVLAGASNTVNTNAALTFDGTTLTVGSPSLTYNGTTLQVQGEGPHAIGGSNIANVQLALQGTFSPGTGIAQGLNILSTLVSVIGQDAYGAIIDPTLNKAGSGTHGNFVSLVVQPPTIGAGAASLTNAATIRITGAPSGATNNYALWVTSGISAFNGALVSQGGVYTTVPGGLSGTYTQVGYDTGNNYGFIAAANYGSSYSDLVVVGSNVRVQYGGTEGMRLTSTGVLAVGTTVTTGAAAGDLVLSNAKWLRGVNAAGTSTHTLIGLNTSDQVEIAQDGQDILWGKALVVLGGGAAPTLGTIGGSGPATAAQNSWMRVMDSTGVAFWVPAWK